MDHGLVAGRGTACANAPPRRPGHAAPFAETATVDRPHGRVLPGVQVHLHPRTTGLVSVDDYRRPAGPRRAFRRTRRPIIGNEGGRARRPERASDRATCTVPRDRGSGPGRQSVGCVGTVFVKEMQLTVSGAHALSGSAAACCGV